MGMRNALFFMYRKSVAGNPLSCVKHPGRRKRRLKRFLAAILLVLAFLICWCFLTIGILFVQQKAFSSADEEENAHGTFTGRGVQVIVGHYNGNLAAERLANLSKEEINANNYSPIPGYGEEGRPVRLSDNQESLAENTFSINQFNLYISDRIALNRSLPDVRKHQCRKKIYPMASELPSTSIIIVYHNEAFSTLLRTVISVINRTPKEVLEEIILVDDFSTRTFLKNELDEAIASFGTRIKILRAQERVGLIRARLMGAYEASGQVLTFLDSHCECTVGWIEPLLARIKENRKAVVCPVIDVINDRTFAYQKGIELFRGGFNWNLQFRWYSVPPELVRKRVFDPTMPIDSPTMAGGLFSIDRQYFEELGTYDPAMDIWGGENIEISFRVWQCGGRIEILPCSHVGHIFRKASPHDFPGKSSGKILNANLLRVAEVWMDDWKYFFYKMVPQARHMRKTIDVSDRVELRKRLHCKDFNWYLKNVWMDHFMPLPGTMFGRIANIKTNYCLLVRPGDPGNKLHTLTMAQCSLGFDLWQLWLYTQSGQVRTDEHLCLSAYQSKLQDGNWVVQLKECGQYDNELWTYSTQKKTLYHRKSGLCLDQPKERLNIARSISVNVPTLGRCSSRKYSQHWQIFEVQWLPDEFDL